MKRLPSNPEHSVLWLLSCAMKGLYYAYTLAISAAVERAKCAIRMLMAAGVNKRVFLATF